jgi:hypothetical protein
LKNDENRMKAMCLVNAWGVSYQPNTLLYGLAQSEFLLFSQSGMAKMSHTLPAHAEGLTDW